MNSHGQDEPLLNTIVHIDSECCFIEICYFQTKKTVDKRTNGKHGHR